MQYIDYQDKKNLLKLLTNIGFRRIFVAQNLKAMKSKKEEKKNNDDSKKMSVENEKKQEASNEVHEQKFSSEAESEDFEHGEMEDKVALIERWAPFLTKFIKVMIAIEDLLDAKKTMEGDPYFVHIMEKFMEFKEQYFAEHPEVMEEGIDEDYDLEDKELFGVVKEMKDKLQQCGISVKVRKVTDPAEIEHFERIIHDQKPSNGAVSMAEA